MKHDKREEMARPEMPPPSLHLDEEDIRGGGTLEVGDTVTLSVKAHVAGKQEEEREGHSKHLMLRMEISDVSVDEKNRVKQR